MYIFQLIQLHTNKQVSCVIQQYMELCRAYKICIPSYNVLPYFWEGNIYAYVYTHTHTYNVLARNLLCCMV